MSLTTASAGVAVAAPASAPVSAAGHLLKLERLGVAAQQSEQKEQKEHKEHKEPNEHSHHNHNHSHHHHRHHHSSGAKHTFIRPTKRIFDGPDVARFLVSTAYRDLGLFILQLNHAMCPRATTQTIPTAASTTVFTLQQPRADPPSVCRLQQLLGRLDALIDQAPPDPGPRRFGNASFRTWHRLLAEQADGLLQELVGVGGQTDQTDQTDQATAMDEVAAYFLGSFGSAQRLDYGTGHELSFLAFLGSLWKLGVSSYLRVVRRLILTYTLEPAGSHGVWGLDDHFFLPYIFGSAQLTRPIAAATAASTPMPQEGSAPGAPKPADVLRPATVAVQRQQNLYFAAVGFIDDVKTGPFWEHSPILFDVSGIADGWGKINKGMIKMYNAEVLSKFPVVQHFAFGSLFAWTADPDAETPQHSVHMASQPATASTATATATATASATNTNAAAAATAAPWAQATRMPGTLGLPGPGIPYSRVPARPGLPSRPGSSATATPTSQDGGSTAAQIGLTRAPWAK
ncbi:phosphotyrosyl phosphatase activator [Grosmannia clavigera kw1407]|uniref:Serine/threonine-protein phosphatase 2A activator n=1 Tax=Grosmannia clavigera (strain kw1407 / UAMH 11150) TaxID=655863 RepID=F0X9M7_GROCL|nr:phosphotyrosyl phosphatase activator [Grosmannia clavigera kw1407]EFX05595.1 phosphotyrosyl phosphatase activator [Grosmannia clavigera kw1407]